MTGWVGNLIASTVAWLLALVALRWLLFDWMGLPDDRPMRRTIGLIATVISLLVGWLW